MTRRVAVYGEAKALRAVTEGKPSVNSATWALVVDAKPGDLSMVRLKRELYRVEDRTHLG